MPANSPSSMCRLLSNSAITTAGTSSMTSGRKRVPAAVTAAAPAIDAPPASDVVAAATCPAPPHTANTMNATIPAGTAYSSRRRTVPPMSASCVVLLAIVVSDTGEIESPNVAPARIAPASIAGSAASAPPAG